jgi:hypothetical protein
MSAINHRYNTEREEGTPFNFEPQQTFNDAEQASLETLRNREALIEQTKKQLREDN